MGEKGTAAQEDGDNRWVALWLDRGPGNLLCRVHMPLLWNFSDRRTKQCEMCLLDNCHFWCDRPGSA